jgi:CspA family cold shock protein
MKARKQQDDIRYCERCGISFLWSSEEQKQAAQTDQTVSDPQLCAGCRQLLPVEGFERGLVKFFNNRRRYGFIARRNGLEIYVHGSDVMDIHRLQPDDLVEFTIIETPRGPAAGAVRVLEHAPA